MCEDVKGVLKDYKYANEMIMIYLLSGVIKRKEVGCETTSEHSMCKSRLSSFIIYLYCLLFITNSQKVDNHPHFTDVETK